jgi:hypothetical protein
VKGMVRRKSMGTVLAYALFYLVFFALLVLVASFGLVAEA